MRRPRWYAMVEQQPKRDGRYWVFPYRSLSGHVMVTMASYKDGQWVSPSRPQEFAYWKPIDVPEPPKVKYAKDNHFDSDTATELLNDLRRNPDRRR